MSDDALGPGPHTRARRLPEKANYDAPVINAVLDEARYCNVAGVVNGRAMTLATLHAREGRVRYLHASQSNALMKSLVDTGEACVSATLYDGLRLARSGFESSIAYRSVVLFGRASVVDDDEKRRVMELFVESVLAGATKSYAR